MKKNGWWWCFFFSKPGSQLAPLLLLLLLLLRYTQVHYTYTVSLHCTSTYLGDVVHVLRFDERLEVVLDVGV